MKSDKASAYKNIPAKKLKETSDICGKSLMDIWNIQIVRNKIFPINLKLADISPIFKNDDATLVKNYRPQSVLPVVMVSLITEMHTVPQTCCCNPDLPARKKSSK